MSDSPSSLTGGQASYHAHCIPAAAEASKGPKDTLSDSHQKQGDHLKPYTTTPNFKASQIRPAQANGAGGAPGDTPKNLKGSEFSFAFRDAIGGAEGTDRSRQNVELNSGRKNGNGHLQKL